MERSKIGTIAIALWILTIAAAGERAACGAQRRAPCVPSDRRARRGSLASAKAAAVSGTGGS
jgi:hypothetical protein